MTSVFFHNQLKIHLLTSCIPVMARTLGGACGCGLGSGYNMDAGATQGQVVVCAQDMVVTVGLAMA